MLLAVALLLDIGPPPPLPTGIGMVTEGSDRLYAFVRGSHERGAQFRVLREFKPMGRLQLDVKEAEGNEIRVQIWRVLPLEGTRLETLRQGDVLLPIP